MPQSLFLADGAQYIDGVGSPSGAPWLMDIGVAYLGGSKAFVRRGLCRFNLLGAPYAGRALTGGDAIVSAELLLDVAGGIGPSGWGAYVERISRPDWDYTQATWALYRAGASWTAPGGDVAAPPASIAFAAPASGALAVDGMAPYVTDALAGRGGAVLLRLKAGDEQPATSQSISITAGQASSLRPRLRVTYASSEPAPIDRPHPGVMHGSRRAAAAAASPAATAGTGAPAASGARPSRPRGPALRGARPGAPRKRSIGRD